MLLRCLEKWASKSSFSTCLTSESFTEFAHLAWALVVTTEPDVGKVCRCALRRKCHMCGLKCSSYAAASKLQNLACVQRLGVARTLCICVFVIMRRPDVVKVCSCGLTQNCSMSRLVCCYFAIGSKFQSLALAHVWLSKVAKNLRILHLRVCYNDWTRCGQSV